MSSLYYTILWLPVVAMHASRVDESFRVEGLHVIATRLWFCFLIATHQRLKVRAGAAGFLELLDLPQVRRCALALTMRRLPLHRQPPRQQQQQQEQQATSPRRYST